MTLQAHSDTARLWELLEPEAEAMGYELVEIELAGGRRNPLLRIYIDAPGGITLDDCEFVSRQLSAVLDVEDPIPAQYTLEVSSPGIERPLVKRAHFERAVGERVQLVTRQYHLGRRRFLGLLREVSGETVVVEVDGESYELPLADVERARLKPEHV